MKTLLLSVLLILSSVNLDACVTYNPSTGTYTIDPHGSIYLPKPFEDYEDWE